MSSKKLKTDDQEEDFDDLFNAGPDDDEKDKSQQESSDEDDDDENGEINPTKFIDDEAALSGDEASSDEEEDEEEKEEQNEADAEEIDEEQNRKKANELFLKQQLDEDKRKMFMLKERLTERDAHNLQTAQGRMKRIKASTKPAWLVTQTESDDDDEVGFAGDIFQDDEESQTLLPGVKVNYKKVTDDQQKEDSNDAPMKLTQFKPAFQGNAGKIDTYIIKDKRTLAAINHKTPSPEVQFLRRNIKKHAIRRKKLY